MNWYKTSQQIYRGDPNPITMQEYNPEYGIKNLGKQLGSSLAEGPGIYFTTKEDEAKGYGENVSKFNLNNANILTSQSKKFSYRQIDKIVSEVDKETLEGAALNWNENYNIGKKLLIESITANENPIEQLMGIWADVFYHQHPSQFMELMTRNGIDGIAITQRESTHYVIYNRNLLK